MNKAMGNPKTIKCGICRTDFNLKDRQPHLLSCLHSFCAVCLHDLTQKQGNGEITCPKCKKVHKVTKSVSKLPVDPVLVKQLEQQQVVGGSILCDECPEDQTPKPPADSRCQICKLYLCKDCNYVHKRHRATRDHAVITLGDLSKEPLASLGRSHFCSSHPANPVDVYCNNCNISCCEKCMLHDHKGHTHVNNDKARQASEKDVEPSLNGVKRYITAIQKAKAEAEKHEIALDKNLSTSIREIEEMFERLEKHLKDQKVKLLKLFNNRSSELSRATQKRIAEYEEALARFEETTSYYAEVREKADDVEKIEILPLFKVKFTAVAEEAKKVKTSVDKTTVHYRNVNEDKMVELMRSLGKVVDNDETKPKELKRSPSSTSDLSAGSPSPLPRPYAKVGPFSVHLTTGDITKVHCDAIVSSATRQLTNDCGVALPIAKAAGQSMADECKLSLQSSGKLAVGDVLVTTAGNMPSQHVLHAARPTWEGDKKTFLADLSRTILRCLVEACNVRVKSVAFPAMGTGMVGVPQDEAARLFARAVRIFSSCTTGVSLTTIHFVDIDDNKTKLLKDAFNNMTIANGDPRAEDVSVIRKFLKQGNFIGSTTKA